MEVELGRKNITNHSVIKEIKLFNFFMEEATQINHSNTNNLKKKRNQLKTYYNNIRK